MYLVTRPEPKLAASAQAFAQAELCASVVALQTIKSIPSQARKSCEWLCQHNNAILVITSKAAAEALNEALIGVATQFPPATRIVAVGKGTADALADLSKMVITPERESSEGLLDLPLLHDCTGQHILLLKGKGGRTHIQETLVARGAQLTIFDVYERITLASPLFSQPINWKAINGIVATSGEQAQCLLNTYQAQSLHQYRWLTVSERIAEQLRQQGIEQINICTQANDLSLIAWIKQNWE